MILEFLLDSTFAQHAAIQAFPFCFSWFLRPSKKCKHRLSILKINSVIPVSTQQLSHNTVASSKKTPNQTKWRYLLTKVIFKLCNSWSCGSLDDKSCYGLKKWKRENSQRKKYQKISNTNISLMPEEVHESQIAKTWEIISRSVYGCLALMFFLKHPCWLFTEVQ